MAAALGFPFTSVQWKELERQAMIYKYMVASVPVPPDLLLPTISPSSTASHYSSYGKDPEPGRCKRTDGKKWRCSRDVAPDQKYCERHLNKGRSRSRKPVEVTPPSFNSNNKRSRLLDQHTVPPTTPTILPNPISHTTSISSSQLLGSTIQPNESIGHNLSSASCFKQPNRGLEWAMGGEMLTMDMSDQQWQNLLQKNLGLSNSSGFEQDFIQEPLNLIPYSDFGAPKVEQRNNESSFFLNPGRDCLPEEQPQMETPRSFIDAWSSNSNNKNETSISPQVGLLPSLTLSMAMAPENTMDEVQMGLGVRDSDHLDPHVASWLSPRSWAGSAPGGPLAEVLQTSSVAASLDSACSYAFNDDSTPASGTRVSSPSGVMPFQWLT